MNPVSGVLAAALLLAASPPLFAQSWASPEDLEVPAVPEPVGAEELAAQSAPSPVDIDRLPAADELGHICHEDLGEYRLTPEDVLWAAKMIDAEVHSYDYERGRSRDSVSREDAESMLWALSNRRWLGRFKRWSFARLTREYSQPINEAWTRTGANCSPFYPNGTRFTGPLEEHVQTVLDAEGLSGEKRAKRARKLRARAWMCSESKVDRRRRNIDDLDWSMVDPTARRLAIEWASGRLPNPFIRYATPGAIGWFAPTVWPGSSHGRTKVGQIDGNVYYADESWANTSGWDEHTVLVVGPGQFCPMVVRRAD